MKPNFNPCLGIDFFPNQRKVIDLKKILLKWWTSHTLVGCSRAGWTSPRSSQRSFSSGSPLRISALGNLHPTKNKCRSEPSGQTTELQTHPSLFNSGYWLSAVVPGSCLPLSLSTAGGVCVLPEGCWETGTSTWSPLTSPQHNRARLGLPVPHWPVALGASSGAGSAGLPLCFQQHLLHVALLGGRGDLLLAPVMICALRGTELELNPGLWKSSQGLPPIC